MNDKYLTQINLLINIGDEVLGTKIVKEYPERIRRGRNAWEEEYVISRTPAMRSEFVDNGRYVSWISDILAYLQNNFQNSSMVYIERIKAEDSKNAFTNYIRAKTIYEILGGFRDKVESGIIQPDSLSQPTDNISNLNIIFNRFHNIVRQLRTRHDKRETLFVNDEYDVQDLLHALLFLYFEDIRSEEWTPSFAGASARMDFLLKNEKTVIEVKKTRTSMTDKTLGNELIEDAARYRAHPDCEKLICFVYDPEGLLGNPNGIMNDLNAQYNGFVDVIIRPL